MFFKDVIGQTEAKRHLLTLVHEGRVPHAILFCGAEGTGKLPLALALTRYPVSYTHLPSPRDS